MLRRDLPRYLDIKKINKEDFDKIIKNDNSTPRKNLNWITPQKAFLKNQQNVALQT